jgi:predicted acyl esterase
VKTKFIAIIISSILIVAASTTLIVYYLTKEDPHSELFDWNYPSNTTFYTHFAKVPYSIPMSDGIGLATDVYLPLYINESKPVIFVRTPYNKDSMSSLASYAEQDFVVVIQDFRGFHTSEGELTMPFISEQDDGQDALLWITDQQWCNGKIGTWGLSALGIAQYLMAPLAPNSLVCQFPSVATPNIYDAVFRGGQLRNELIIPWSHANGFPESTFDLIQTYEKYGDFWTKGNLANNYSNIHAASIHLGGWYDIFTQETINGFNGYQTQGGLGAADNAKLIMGPWVHAGMFGYPTGDIQFPNQVPGIFFKATDGLFEKWLLDNSTLWDQFPDVMFYLMSSLEYNPGLLANNWFQSSSWPIAAVPEDLYLYSNLSLLPSPYNPIANLPAISNSLSDCLTFHYDPNNPVETIGGGNLALAAGVYDQQPLDYRDDVLRFSTPTLTEPLTIVGQIEASLFISSNCTDTDFTVKLIDVYPDNRSMIITDTIIRARNRNGPSNWDFLTPGSIYELNFKLDSTAYLFNEGHKLRIDVSSSNYPRFEPNPNTGDPLWANLTTYVANNTVYANSSKITLPIADYESLTPFSFGLTNPISFEFEDYELNQKGSYAIKEWLPIVFVVFARRSERFD